MVNLLIGEDTLDLQFDGLDRVMSMTSHLSIPLSHISSVEEDSIAGRRLWNGFRSPGTGIPGAVAAGRYRHDGLETLFCVRHKGPALSIGLHDEELDRIVVEVPEVHRSVAELREALGLSTTG